MLDRYDPARGSALRRAREALLKSQAAVAEAGRLHIATVKRAEAGKPMSAETASSLCAVLRIAEGAFVAPNWGGAPTAEVIPATAGQGGSLRPRPRRRWRQAAIGAAVVAFAVEAAAWTPPFENFGVFSFLQAVSLSGVSVSLTCFCLHRLGQAATRSARVGSCALSIAAMASCLWFPSVYLSNGFLTSSEIFHGLNRYVEDGRLIDARAALDPTWDPLLARWANARAVRRFAGDDPRYDTPGAFRALMASKAKCADDFLHAPVYDRAACEPRYPQTDQRLRLLAVAVLSGSQLRPERPEPHGEAFGIGEILADRAFDPSREFLGRFRRGNGTLDRRAYEAAIAALRPAPAGGG